MNEKLLNTIACPITQTKLEWDKENNRLISRSANVYYPIENGIPVLLLEKEEKL
ncbi:Trm112 family protein [Glaesserella parasuis]|nr:Trm112 family protein [Glaesserella parasuis]